MNIYIDGAGMYSWFKDYVQDCVNDNTCQQRLININRVTKSWFTHITAVGAREIITPAITESNNLIRYAKAHLQATVYPWWGIIATYSTTYEDINAPTLKFLVRRGWVAFGDSYAAGIGAGLPLDDVDVCKRGTGSYIAILDRIIRFSHEVQPYWQPLACSGETAQQFLDGTGNGQQLDKWNPESSDMATCSFTGNDLGFSDIVSHCIMGYPLGSRSKCQSDISNAKRILESGKIRELVHDVLDQIHAKAYRQRFIVYWTSYPQFFEVADTTCDSSYFQEGFWAGEYLKTRLRGQLNELSILVNDQIDFAIRLYNAGLPYPKAVHVNIEKRGNIYQGKRFCELGVKETLKDEVDQAKVAFFYDNGWDDIPGESESFYLPPPQQGAPPGGWSIDTYNSGTCSASELGNSSEPLDSMNCDVAKGIASGAIAVGPVDNDTVYNGDVMRNNDGSVTITDFKVRFTKMFHPKTRANWHIAQAVHEALRWN
jgi:hypothetical protein